MNRQRLIDVFKFEPRREGEYVLSWEYRKAYSTYKDDLKILRQLEREGLAKMIDKTTKTVYWQYFGK